MEIDYTHIEEITKGKIDVDVIIEMERFSMASRSNKYATVAGDNYISSLIDERISDPEVKSIYWDLYQNMIASYREQRVEHGRYIR